MKIKDLRPNEKNPRTISEKDREGLKKALYEFGDLGSIIFNRQSKRLAGGHQRVSVIPPSATITIEKKYDVPTKTGTVAEGFVSIDGENFKYREVDWSKDREAAAMIAANKHGGEWDTDLLKVNLADIGDIDISLTGFDHDELKEIGFELAPIEIEETFSREEEEETDEQYVRNQEKTEEKIDTQKIPSTDAPYEKVEEKTEIVNKRFVIIIDCPDQDIKDSLKEKLQPEITQAGCKIF